MTNNNSGPDTSTVVVEGEARKSDQLASEITSENNVSTADVKFHPLANMFPLMEGEEFDALVADIKANGLREPIIIFEGKILDGRNRARACEAAGIVLRGVEHHAGCAHIGDPRAYVISKNLHRRHLTAEQKREVIAKLIKAQPEKPDLQIAKAVKASPTTVGTVRAKMEASGDVSKLETRHDTKGRQQPTKKARKQLKPHKQPPAVTVTITPDQRRKNTETLTACSMPLQM
jgi:ParB-like chromosome segregation protein Spo0J